MIDSASSMVLLAVVSLLVTLINTAIVATTRAAVSELKAELVKELAPKQEVIALERRIRHVENVCARNHGGSEGV